MTLSVSGVFVRCALALAVAGCAAETSGLLEAPQGELSPDDAREESPATAPSPQDPPRPVFDASVTTPRDAAPQSRAPDASAPVEPKPGEPLSPAPQPSPPAVVVDKAVPPVADPALPGGFTVVDRPDTGPAGAYRLFHPQTLGSGHPAVVFGPGISCTPEQYLSLLTLMASQGFVVLAYQAEASADDLSAGIDWLIAANDNSGSELFGKLDVGKLAVMGHSTGSHAAFRIAADPRIVTTVHLSGGSLPPHADVSKLRAPALFICGGFGFDAFFTGDGTTAYCETDYTLAKTPVFYGVPKNGSYTTVIDDVRGDPAAKARVLGATLAWLRWQIGGDAAMQAEFVGSACTLCSDAGWNVRSKGL